MRDPPLGMGRVKQPGKSILADIYNSNSESCFIIINHHVVTSLKGSIRYTYRNGAYHWVLEDGVPTDGKILTYGLAFALLAYSKVRIFCQPEN